jgi:uncharacterized protein with GYD domain
MAKFLIKASFNAEGAKGVLKSGGIRRKELIEKMIREVGGKLEAFYFAFGDDDAYVIVDLPDLVTGAAVALTVNASGLVATTTTVLLTPEDVDKAAKMSVNYVPPGG